MSVLRSGKWAELLGVTLLRAPPPPSPPKQRDQLRCVPAGGNVSFVSPTWKAAQVAPGIVHLSQSP